MFCIINNFNYSSNKVINLHKHFFSFSINLLKIVKIFSFVAVYCFAEFISCHKLFRLLITFNNMIICIDV